MSEPDSPQTAIWRMRIACRTPKATNTHSQYVILIALPPQQRSHERISMLRYALHCLSCLCCRCVFLGFTSVWNKTSHFVSCLHEFQPRHVCPAAPCTRIVMKSLVGQCYRFLHPFQRWLTFWRRNYFCNFNTPCI